MAIINCGSGRVFNPKSGKCISANGGTARDLMDMGLKLTQKATCNGVVKTSSKGNKSCQKKNITKRKVTKKTTAGGKTGGRKLPAPKNGQCLRDLERLRLIHERNIIDIRESKKHAIFLEKQLDKALTSLRLTAMGARKNGSKPISRQQVQMPVRRQR
jgi:hypothetical protein